MLSTNNYNLFYLNDDGRLDISHVYDGKEVQVDIIDINVEDFEYPLSETVKYRDRVIEFKGKYSLHKILNRVFNENKIKIMFIDNKLKFRIPSGVMSQYRLTFSPNGRVSSILGLADNTYVSNSDWYTAKFRIDSNCNYLSIRHNKDIVAIAAERKVVEHKPFNVNSLNDQICIYSEDDNISCSGGYLICKVSDIYYEMNEVNEMNGINTIKEVNEEIFVSDNLGDRIVNSLNINNTVNIDNVSSNTNENPDILKSNE